MAAAKHGVTSSAVSLSPANSGESIAAIIVWHAGTVKPDDPPSLRDYVAELQFKKTIRATSSSTAQDVLQAACKKLQLDPAGHCLVASYMSGTSQPLQKADCEWGSAMGSPCECIATAGHHVLQTTL